MARRLGCCTWTFGAAPLEEIALRVARAGLDGVELHGDVDGIDPRAAAEVLGAMGLEVFSITPGDADISHPDPGIREPALAYYDRLIDWADALGRPRISCHGQVTRIRPVSTQDEEDRLLVDAVRRICRAAAARDLPVVFEILNRYETHQVRTVRDGLALLDAVGAGNLALLPDAYHMNIEEADPAEALREGGARIGLYHAADSNRCGIGEGHTDFAAQVAALDAIGYRGAIILETNAPGPNPFTPDKGEGFRDVVEAQLAASVEALRALGA
jgi:D-psicose/D-tagatose/L-ribulose 3-epimerase